MNTNTVKKAPYRNITTFNELISVTAYSVNADHIMIDFMKILNLYYMFGEKYGYSEKALTQMGIVDMYYDIAQNYIDTDICPIIEMTSEEKEELFEHLIIGNVPIPDHEWEKLEAIFPSMRFDNEGKESPPRKVARLPI